MLSQILFSQCDSLQYDKFEYYYFPEIDVDEGHINSSQDCYHKVDWDILQELILVNNLQYEVFNFGSQTWNLNGRLEILLINYSPADSPQFINQKINSLPENFGELKMLNYLEMQKHNLIVLPPSFIKLQNLQTLLLKLNRLKVLNPDFGLLINLETLDLGYNELVALPESISDLEQLEYLWIFENDINVIPNSICDLEFDWSGETEVNITFGSGGNHLCEDVPSCIENSSFFNIRLEPEGYTSQLVSEQICPCADGTYPDCAGVCPEAEDYGSIIDACEFCELPLDACISDCTGSWGGSSTLDECGICDGDGSACEEVGFLSLDFDELNNTYVIYETPENDNWGIGGFQFDVVGASDFTSDGGIASELGFNITVSGQLILGYSLTGVIIPAGMDTLLIINSEEAITGLSDIIISDVISQPAQSLNFIFDDGYVEVCDLGFDCSGECGGIITLDACGICDGSGTSIWYSDIDGDGLGDSENSSNFCYEYEGYVSNSDDSDDSVFCPYQYLGNNFDCFGNCIVEVDCAGVCGGGATEDCIGDCNGSVLEDECGICGGTGPLGECGCDDIPTGFCDCSGGILDECGVCGGGGILDDCGVCNGGNTVMDDCGVCNGGNAEIDCHGDCAVDTPISCEDTTGNDQCGNAISNLCGCVGGNTELEEFSCFGCRDETAINTCDNCTEYCDETPLSFSCCEYEDLSTETVLLPTEYDIVNNYPNPFNPETTINYSIPKTAWVSLSIYDLKGGFVSTIIDGVENPGNYSVTWNGNNFTNKQIPTGIYFAILKTNEILISHKLLLMK